MEANKPNSPSVRIYPLCFVLVMLFLFLFFMVMSGTQLRTGKFEDVFFQRDLLIENFNRLRIKMGDRVFNQVVIGKDGWMDFTGDRNLDVYQNAIPFSSENLRAIVKNIRSCYAYAREHDFTFLIVVAPNKASIYPEKLPDQIRPLADTSQLDQLNDYLRAHDLPQALDLRPALREARRQRDVYFSTGTHWNEYGAYIAYETILRALSPSHPDVEPYPATFFHFRYFSKDTPRLGDTGLATLIKANYLNLEPTWFATRNTDDFVHNIRFPIPSRTAAYHELSWIPDSHLPSLLMLHDSFGALGLNRLMATNFSKVYYVHRNAAPDYLNRQALTAFSPDIVIYEVVERDLYQLENELVGCVAE